MRNFHVKGFMVKKIAVNFRLFIIETLAKLTL